MFESGEKFGRYIIRSLLGAGGMGKVYLAEDAALERLVALKVLHAELANNTERTQRFIREAKAASALNHPNILTIHEIGEINGLHFMASEFIRGETLADILRQRSLPLNQTLDISSQIISALAAAHNAGIVHRDIKPDNLMVREDNLVKVLDFGLVKLIEQPGGGARAANPLTLDGMIMGTPQYMSPEQAEGKEVDARTDLWSFGAVFYEMLTGERAFPGESIAEVIVSLLIKEPKALSEYKREIPPEIETIVNQLLQKNREERYRSAGDLAIVFKNLKRRFEIETEHDNRPLSPSNIVKEETSFEAPQKIFAEKISTLPPNNLLENVFPMVGREKEIGEICGLLRKEQIRLLTMTGIGGTGKTTISQAVAREMLPEFPDGVFFIELDTITSPDLVASTIAQPLGLKEAGGKPILEMLKEYLREREILLVLDNYEQIARAASVVAEIIAAAPRLKVLVTSRVLLHLRSEREFIVPPMGLPGDGEDSADLMQSEAVRLFVERAQMVKPNFTLSDENILSIAEICKRLDGLPLAIEFAAARSKILSPQAILSKLENRLQLLTGGAHDLPSRQQTMRGAIEWSYDLLTENEKTLFRRLAIFAGGFSFEAAESVVAAAGQNFQKLENVLDDITSLVDKSLLISKEQSDGQPRFGMLEVVREFALESLTNSGEAEVMRHNHARYFLALGEEAESHLISAQAVEWLNRLEEEYDNLRAALRWSLERDAETAIRLAGAIRNFWISHSHLTEGRAWLKAALDCGRETSAPRRFKLLSGLGVLARFQGDYETSRRAFEEGLAVGRATGDKRQIVLSCRGLGMIIYKQGEVKAARAFHEEALAISRELEDKFLIALSLTALGDLLQTEGMAAEARPHFEESLMISRQLDIKQIVNGNLINLGTVAFREGNYKLAESYFTEGLTTARELGEKTALSYTFDGFAALAVKQGNTNLAAKFAGAAEALRASLGAKSEPTELNFRNFYLAELHALLNEAEFNHFYEIGRKMKLNEVINLALEKE